MRKLESRRITGLASVAVDHRVDVLAQPFVARGKVSRGQLAEAAPFLALCRPADVGANRLVDRLPDGLAFERRTRLERPVRACIDVADGGVHVCNVVNV